MVIDVNGTVKIAAGPLPGYKVTIFALVSISGRDPSYLRLGEATTNADGKFSLHFSMEPDIEAGFIPEDKHDVYVRVSKPSGEVVVFESLHKKAIPYEFSIVLPTIPETLIISDPGLFKCQHCVCVDTPISASGWERFVVRGEKKVVTLTGIVQTDISGASPEKIVMLELKIKPPSNMLPPYHDFIVEQYAPYITINDVYNGSTARARWAVEEFLGPGLVTIHSGSTFSLYAKIAVGDADGILKKIAYNVTLAGTLVFVPVIASASGAHD